MAIIIEKYYDSGNFEAEVLMKCKVCKTITPHRWIRQSWVEEDGHAIYEVIHDTYICKNCKHEEKEHKIIPL